MALSVGYNVAAVAQAFVLRSEFIGAFWLVVRCLEIVKL
jgi:hypothetical protein